MPDNYYRLPLRLDLITNSGQAERQLDNSRELLCSLEESLWDNIYLVLTTPFNEVRYDPAFGSAIWDYDLIGGSDMNEIRWEEDIKDLVKESMKQYEKRIEGIDVKFKLNREGYNDAHKRLGITITGKIRALDNQTFRFNRDIIIAPFIGEPLR